MAVQLFESVLVDVRVWRLEPGDHLESWTELWQIQSGAQIGFMLDVLHD